MSKRKTIEGWQFKEWCKKTCWVIYKDGNTNRFRNRKGIWSKIKKRIARDSKLPEIPRPKAINPTTKEHHILSLLWLSDKCIKNNLKLSSRTSATIKLYSSSLSVMKFRTKPSKALGPTGISIVCINSPIWRYLPIKTYGFILYS